MVFSNSSTKAGIVEEIDFYINTDSTSYPIEQRTRNINRHLDHVVSLILSSDGRWAWDDSNNTDLPIATATLVSDQQDYSIAGGTFLDVIRVEVKDAAGNYQVMTPIDQRDVVSQSLTEFQKTAGMPRYYDKIGDSIFLYPKPSTSLVTASAGLKVYFQRVASYFATSDTTKVPGFNPLYHRILSVGAALDYAIQNDMVNKVNILSPMYQKLEAGIVECYSSRSKDEQVRARVRNEDYGQNYDGYESGYRGSDKTAFY